MSETGPIYNVPLLNILPIPNSNMQQQMPCRSELEAVQVLVGNRTVAAYEVSLATIANQQAEIERLQAIHRNEDSKYMVIERAEVATLRHKLDALLACRHGDQRCHKCPDTDCGDNQAAEAVGDDV